MIKGKSRKWKLWKSSSGSRGSRPPSDAGSDASSVAGADGFSTAVAQLVRAPLKDFKAVREEWAAIRIQTAFRGFLVGEKDRIFFPFIRVDLSLSA